MCKQIQETLINFIEGIMELLQSTSTHLVVVCLAIYAIARLGFRAYENTFQKDGISEKRQTMKIHLLYIAGILLFIIIELASYLAIKSDPIGESLMQYISFASTLTSIILSILAIILTIVTTSKGDSTILKIEQASEKLDQTLLKLKDISERYNEKVDESCKNLQNANDILRNTSSEIKESLSTTFDNMKRKLEELDTNVCESKAEIYRLGNSIDRLKDGDTTSSDRKPTNIDYKNLIQTGSFLGNLGLLACCIAYKTKKPVIYIKKINSEWEQYIAGYLVALSTTQMLELVIQVKSEEGLYIDVKGVHEDVEEKEIRQQLEDYINRPDNRDHIEENNAVLSAVDKYFKVF